MASTKEVLDTLPSEEELTAKCLELGLVMRQSPSFSITHPAVALHPMPMRTEVLEQLYDRQLLWNEAINRTARNFQFLRDSMRSTADSDRDFTGRLVTMLENVYLTAPPGASGPVFQPLMLGIFRTDYMRSVDPEPTDAKATAAAAAAAAAAVVVSAVDSVESETASQWKNIEINTISCSFAGLSPLVQRFHHYLDKYRAACMSSAAAVDPATASAVIAAAASRHDAVHTSDHQHNSLTQVPAAVAAAVHAWQHATPLPSFLRQYEQRTGVVLKPIVLVIIQEGERNTADQYKLLLELLERHGVLSIRRTLTQLHESLRLEHATIGDHSRDRTTASKRAAEQPKPPFAVVENTYVVAVAYFRSTYVPQDFPSEGAWKTRAWIEESNAVKCPSIPYHLMTFKKMQQLMSNITEVLTPICFAGDPHKADALAQHFVPQYSLNKDEYARSSEHKQKNDAGVVVDDPEYWIQDAAAHPEKYVLKPQLEGGGNLIAGPDMQRMLRETKAEDPLFLEIRREYILMRRIHHPVITGILFRQNKIHVLENNICSELGIYGVTLSAEAGRYLVNEAAGCVVRSKPADVADGGVMAGVAALDSVLLIGRSGRCGGGRCCGYCSWLGRPPTLAAVVGSIGAAASVAVAAAAWAARQRRSPQ
ncbi:putative glutathione synthetase [Leptomonas pyrrhocoris]|uniref:Glutathione synthetase n=1 Tax=Leptomonas pyrrhocoris TaxID=157538 RepID=A0A0N0DTE4_LEPPY|nr:putative glutathione synthetase [Leptomonas pyrrhocoris]KPA77284.1 putative glutathione synthetase [Leptomonas pyrrhocoris]|eukprot:XP_015655723.1 putative glutathione synthetase [Leptomonas pyrrhocoris]